MFILSDSGPLSREYSLKDQLRRSSLSIISNIAEGFG
ncbi:four helix bundle protein, partial [bacterium]|nr:four helix bundle protein [bacterium]